jgi:ribulose-5-phosphate 4-epimerase/fuculose-1-phosphate aldolase
MLVNSVKFGEGLASKFSNIGSPDLAVPDANVVLMANHGFTTLGTSIKQAVYRAVYTNINASVQTNAMSIRSAASNGALLYPTYSMRFLDERQVKGSLKLNDASQDRPWELWVAEVKTCALYKHEGRR